MTDHRAVVLACRAHARDVEVATTTGSFARASTATYTDVAGVVQTAAVDEFRSGNYLNGVLTPLFESAATNVIPYSDAFDNGAWNSVVGDGAANIIAANAGAAPDGTTTADRVRRASQPFTPSGTGVHTFSVYVKASAGTTDSTWMSFAVNGKTSLAAGGNTNILEVRVTWSGGVPTAAINGGIGSLSATETVGNGWYRIGGYAAVGTHNFYVVKVTELFGTSDCLVWGAQVESGASRTSYIPTTATSATRAADIGGLAATTSGFTRTSGSFLTDGFRIGQEVTPTGFTSSTVGTITAVTALAMTVTGTRTADTAAGGRTLAVNLPASVAYLNVPHEPTVGAPWVEEQYLPGSADQYTVATTGTLETLPIYALTVYGPTGIDIAGLMGYADALLDHFAPGTPLTVASGDLRVRARPAPFASPVQIVDGGWAAVTVSVPLRYHTANPR